MGEAQYGMVGVGNAPRRTVADPRGTAVRLLVQ